MNAEPTTAATIAKRRDVLSVLSAPATKPELVQTLDISRSTVDRAIDALLEHALVERRGSEYVATYAGREGVAAYERYLDRVAALERAQPVLAELPPDVDIDPAVLEGAEVVESTPEAPEAPIEANIDYLVAPTAFRGTGPTVLPQYIDVMTALAEDEGVETEIVVTESVATALKETYEDGFARLAGASGLGLYVTDEPMPYAVWTAESPDRTGSGIVVYGDNGVAGVINNDTPAMNEWAREQYERYRASARPLD